MPRSACRTEADLVAEGARETAARMAEQFRRQQCLWNAAAVHGHERLPTARTVLVNEPGHHFLAYARLTGNEYFALVRAALSMSTRINSIAGLLPSRTGGVPVRDIGLRPCGARGPPDACPVRAASKALMSSDLTFFVQLKERQKVWAIARFRAVRVRSRLSACLLGDRAR